MNPHFFTAPLLIFLTSDTDVPSVFLTVFLILCVSPCNARLIMLP